MVCSSTMFCMGRNCWFLVIFRNSVSPRPNNILVDHHNHQHRKSVCEPPFLYWICQLSAASELTVATTAPTPIQHLHNDKEQLHRHHCHYQQRQHKPPTTSRGPKRPTKNRKNMSSLMQRLSKRRRFLIRLQ